MVQKLHICEKVYFDQLLDFPILHLLFLHCITLYYCAISYSLGAGFFNTIRYQTVWTQIRPNVFSGLIWVQTVCKGYQQTTKSPLAIKKLKTKQLVDNAFWLRPWLRLISFGYNFFHLAKVLATTNSEPG